MQKNLHLSEDIIKAFESDDTNIFDMIRQQKFVIRQKHFLI